ncbi:MAG: hypothetical protein WCA89_01510 [Terracidiphilus sp.]
MSAKIILGDQWSVVSCLLASQKCAIKGEKTEHFSLKIAQKTGFFGAFMFTI